MKSIKSFFHYAYTTILLLACSSLLLAQSEASIKEKYDREVDKYDSIFITKAGKHFIKRKLKIANSYKFIESGQNILDHDRRRRHDD